jgi:hypothetical protein
MSLLVFLVVVSKIVVVRFGDQLFVYRVDFLQILHDCSRKFSDDCEIVNVGTDVLVQFIVLASSYPDVSIRPCWYEV